MVVAFGRCVGVWWAKVLMIMLLQHLQLFCVRLVYVRLAYSATARLGRPMTMKMGFGRHRRGPLVQSGKMICRWKRGPH